MPADVDVWSALDVELGLDDVLTTRTLPRQTALADGYGYVARRLRDDDDWEQLTGRALAENLASGEYEPAAHETFVRARTAIQRELSDRGVATFVGAFTPEGVLVADLGIVVCGRRARYQNVGTDEAHRRRGLASHLLGIAARWAAEQGCDEWVIVTESTNPAGRVYRSVGFAPDVPSVQAYRPPPARFGRV
jgi:GNAT superfamily N-acetyltransferase